MVDVTSGDVYCDVCTHKIGNYLNDDYYKLIATKYCPVCRELIRGNQLREAQRARRRRQKQNKKEMKQTISEFEKRTKLLVQQNNLLQEQIEQLKQEGRR